MEARLRESAAPDWGMVQLFCEAALPVRAGRAGPRGPAGAGGRSGRQRSVLDAARAHAGGDRPAGGGARRAHAGDARSTRADAEAVFRLGATWMKLHRDDEALAAFERCLALDPGMTKAMINLGVLHDQGGRPDQAIQAFRHAIEANPRSVESHCNLGAAYGDLGRKKDAIAEFEKALAHRSRLRAGALQPRARADGHDPGGLAGRAAQGAGARSGELGDQLQPRARLLPQGDVRHVREACCSSACRRGRTPRPALYYLGVAYNKKDQPGLAIECLEKGVDLDPNNGRAHFYLGVAYDKKGQSDRARLCYQAADRLGGATDGRFGAATPGPPRVASTGRPRRRSIRRGGPRRSRAGAVPHRRAIPTGDLRRRAVLALAEAGADVLELGIPFSDPLADGPTIQASSQRALAAGVTVERILERVAARAAWGLPIVRHDLREPGPGLRVRTASRGDARGRRRGGDPRLRPAAGGAARGVGGVPCAGLERVVLVAPTTSPARLPLLAAAASGYVYCLTRTGVTGRGGGFAGNLAEQARARARPHEPAGGGRLRHSRAGRCPGSRRRVRRRGGGARWLELLSGGSGSRSRRGADAGARSARGVGPRNELRCERCKAQWWARRGWRSGVTAGIDRWKSHELDWRGRADPVGLGIGPGLGRRVRHTLSAPVVWSGLLLRPAPP